MSLKAVELQVALPRTQEVTRIQDQQQQRSMHDQQEQIAARKELDELTRKRPTDVSETVQGQVREKQEREKRRDAGQKQRKRSDEEQSEAKREQLLLSDPVRGRHIDISL
ncbi:hypothetical protein LOK74_06545 [Brevibacillus humidisoli]|uniref:hypothetical protein n=1 Tax=Brevibacillus humidisoli TaxID=2895522 RepID=UPI001E2C5FE1|nr:hypothetical protein [Brevibacillus humidisoli]UFJ42151.1 hypothetical protein LOK74_06545 [Brevibacillus humidisoli]